MTNLEIAQQARQDLALAGGLEERVERQRVDRHAAGGAFGDHALQALTQVGFRERLQHAGRSARVLDTLEPHCPDTILRVPLDEAARALELLTSRRAQQEIIERGPVLEETERLQARDSRAALAPREMDHPEPDVFCGQPVEDPAGAVARSVIDHDDLERPMRQPEQRAGRRFDPQGFVPRRHHDGDRFPFRTTCSASAPNVQRAVGFSTDRTPR